MADSNLNVTVASQEVRVGDAANSKVLIDIENKTDGGVTYTFYLTIPASFVAAGKAGDTVFSPLEATTADVVQPPNGTKWRVGTKRGTTIPKGSRQTLTLSTLNATAAGPQTVSVEWFKGVNLVGSASLTVTVLAQNDLPKIVSFEAESYVLTKSAVGQSPIKLRWQTDEQSAVTLSRLAPPPLLPNAPRQQLDWWPDTDNNLSGLQPYQLTATFQNKTVSRWLFVRVQDPGWNRIQCSQGAPTLLLNDGDRSLYGVFLRDGEAAVYKLDPDRGTLGREDARLQGVPAGMETSPGVFFKNKLWLIGGSQLDPQVCSKQVWWFDPVSKQQELINASWSPRMGHACTVFDNKLWILGGLDENGNTLGEVYWSEDGRTWTRGKALPTSLSLCMLAATAFDDKLWIYGGVDAPFGTPQRGLYFIERGGNWKLMKFRGQVGKEAATAMASADPFGSALCVDNSDPAGPELTGIVTLQTAGGLVSQMLQLTGIVGDEADLHPDVFPVGKDKGWPTTKDTSLQQAFRLSAVSFKNYIFVVSLVYGTDNRSLTYLVQ